MMNPFSYSMPVKIFYGENCIAENKSFFRGYGKKAFIVTGKMSSKLNGSLDDVICALTSINIEYAIYNEIEENPSIEQVEAASRIGIESKVDFVIGLGGGSPMDASKAIAILIKNPNATGEALLSLPLLNNIPLILIPTTAGTGSETTPFSVLTVHKQKTKTSMSQRVFAEAAFLDMRYTMDMPKNVTINTVIDALAHLIESYLCTRANYLSDKLNESGFSIFNEYKDELKKFPLSLDAREKFLIMSSIAGMTIAQTGTSLPHAMGYDLTYFDNAAHGFATGVLIAQYLKVCDNEKTNKMLSLIGFKNIDEADKYFKEILVNDLNVSEAKLTEYTKSLMNNQRKLDSHPIKVSYEDIYSIYKNSLWESK